MHAMKKTMLAAAAALGATAACAADVTVYGLVDYGLMYTGTDNGSNTSHVTEMTSGKNLGSRFGFKGSEDLGNGLKVGFILETVSVPIPAHCPQTAGSSIVNPRFISKVISAISSSVA